MAEAEKETSANSILQEESRIGYYIYDGRGSVSQVVSGTGDLVTGYSYDPFGNMAKGGPEAGNVFGYNGEAYNAVANIWYLRARYYDAGTGRFISEDDYMGNSVEPLSRNRYIYGQNNPVSYEDPGGRFIGYALKTAVKMAVTVVKKVFQAYRSFSKAYDTFKSSSSARNKVSTAVGKVAGVMFGGNKAVTKTVAKGVSSALIKTTSKSKSAAF